MSTQNYIRFRQRQQVPVAVKLVKC